MPDASSGIRAKEPGCGLARIVGLGGQDQGKVSLADQVEQRQGLVVKAPGDAYGQWQLGLDQPLPDDVLVASWVAEAGDQLPFLYRGQRGGEGRQAQVSGCFLLIAVREKARGASGSLCHVLLFPWCHLLPKSVVI